MKIEAAVQKTLIGLKFNKAGRNRRGGRVDFVDQDVEFAVAVGDEVAAVVFEELRVVHIGAAAVFLRAVLDVVLDAVVVDDDLRGFPDDACWALGVALFFLWRLSQDWKKLPVHD